MRSWAAAFAFLTCFALSVCGVIGVRPALAASGGLECSEIAWPVGKDREAFSSTELPKRSSGARLRRIDRAVELSLKAPDQVEMFMRPAVALDKQRFSGAVTFFGVPRPGLYQVTLSDPAEVEVFENGMRLKPLNSVRAQNCPGVAQSARYQLAPGDLVLVEIINASQSTIKVAFDQAETKTGW